MLQAGHALGPYVILSHIGSGGMSDVYCARDVRLGREVAVKVLRSHLADDEGRRRFEREARIVAAISHPNVLALFDVGGGQPLFIVTEMLKGQTLHARLRERPVGATEILDVSRQLAAGVASAHQRGIVHRDLKPANTFLTNDGVLKVLDFGLSRAIQQVSTGSDAESLTQTGTVLGTPHYMAPEQVRAGEVGARTDVFAMGAIMFEMATGVRAFTGASPAEVMVSVLNSHPSFEVLRPGLPPRFGDVVATCLAKDPGARYPSGLELKRALDDLCLVSTDPIADTVAVVDSFRAIASPSHAARASIAVFPFADMSAELNMGYFCDGIVDEITTALSSLDGVRVAPRGAAARCKQLGLDATESGKRLKVQYLLEGGVRVSGKRIRATVQLTSVAEGYQIWAERYDRTVDSIFELQDEIARAIVSKLSLKLTPVVETFMERRPTANTDAYALYLKGRDQLTRRSRGLVNAALRSFEHAVAIDENYALAHAAIAMTHTMSAAYGFQPGLEVQSLAIAAAARALSLDGMLAEAHEASAAVKTFLEWDLVGAELAWKRACDLAPTRGDLFASRAINLAHGAQLERACEIAEHAFGLEPESPYVCWLAAVPVIYSRRYERALAMLDQALALDETAIPAYWIRTWALTELGRHAEAIRSAERAVSASDRQPIYLATLGYALARAGQRAAARDVLEEMRARRAAGEFVPALQIANVKAALGDVTTAVASLERAFADRDAFLVSTAVTPLHDSLRGEPAYVALLKKVRLAAPVATRIPR